MVLIEAQTKNEPDTPLPVDAHSVDLSTLPPVRQFDFLIGDWDMYEDQERIARASFRKIIEGFAIEQDEVYYSNGTVSKALWSYSRREGDVWVQSWVDIWGYHVVSKGGREGDRMVLYMTTKYFESNVNAQVLARQIFSSVERDSFRYTWEISLDEGKTWMFNNASTYERRQP